MSASKRQDFAGLGAHPVAFNDTMSFRLGDRPTTNVSIDLCDYCRLTELDEIGIHQALITSRDRILKPTLSRNNGHIVKLTGDGALIIFPNASEAVQSMIEFQRHIARWGEKMPGDRRLVFRVGIHLATVIVDGSDLYGKGVNLAVRLQEVAQPGSIFLSGEIVKCLSRSSDIRFQYLGRRALKKILLV